MGQSKEEPSKNGVKATLPRGTRKTDSASSAPPECPREFLPAWRRASAPFALARFGVFEFRLDTGELRKDGASVRLQRRSFCVLQALLEHHGEVVTREELRARIWSEGTFVDFESGLNTAVNRLRCALGDSAEAPVYVETMARLGYRFVAPVIFSAMSRESEKTEVASASTLPADSGRSWWMAAAGVTVLGALLVWLGVTAFSVQRPFHYKQLTFSVGCVETARFLNDGKEVVYRLISRGNLRQAFRTSSNGEDVAGSKALGAAEEQSEFAEGSAHARITSKNGWFAMEYPVGRPLYRTRARLETLRVAPRGNRVAFIERPEIDDDGGCLMVASAAEAAHCLSGGWDTIKGVAWTPSGDEVWFTAGTSGSDQSLRAVNLRGRVRSVAEMPGGMILLDINRAGDVLIARPSAHVSMVAGAIGETMARDLSLFDWSRAVGISADGKSLLFDESGQGGGSRHSVYLYDMEHKRTERIGDGLGVDLARDGAWALLQKADDRKVLWLVSTRDHKDFAVKAAGATYHWARFLGGRDCQEIVASVSDANQQVRLIEQELPNGKPLTLISDLALSDAIVDEGGQTLVGRNGDSALVLVDLGKKTKRPLALAQEARPVSFGRDGRLIISRSAGRSVVLESVNLQNGSVEPYGEALTNGAAGFSELVAMRLAKDGRTFVYSRLESVSTLYVVSGWM